MTNEEARRRLQGIVGRGKKVYEEKLKTLLEPTHIGEFLAIEPETGRYFLGATVLAAMDAAQEAMPEDVFYVMRVGYDYVHKFGVLRVGQTRKIEEVDDAFTKGRI